MTDQAQDRVQAAGMSRKLTRRIEYSIIGLCIVAMLMIFQPFFKVLFTAGCVLVVIGGLAFNLVPLCEPGRPLKSVVRGGVIVAIVFAVVVGLALGSAYLYGIYLGAG